MSRMSKKDKEEYQIFLDDRGRMSYNKQCRNCVRECKQSYRVDIVYCPIYKSKRALGD